MRPYLAVSLLLWSLLFLSHEAQGIRLDKKHFMQSRGQQKVDAEDGSDLMKKTNGAAGDQVMILCKDGHCSSGKNRKLITTSTSTTTTTTISKNEKSGQEYYNKADPMSKGQSGNGEEHGEEQTFMVSGNPTSDEHPEIAHEHFLDNIDHIADMDYSPAKRKPPIHN